MLRGSLALITILIIGISKVVCEDIPDTNEFKPKFGLFGHIGLNTHTSQFATLPGVPSCCIDYSGGNGIGYSFGGLFDLPINYNMQINFRIGVSVNDGFFSERENTVVIVDDKSIDGVFEHRLDIKHSVLSLSPMFGYRLSKDFFVHGGIGIGLPIVGTHDYFEKVVEPATKGTFTNGKRTRNESVGDIEKLSAIQMFITTGISYSFPLNKRKSLFIAPEIFYSFWIISPVKDLTWNIHTFRGGIAIKYRQPPPPPPPPPPPLPAPLPKYPKATEPPSITASIEAFRVDSNGNEDSEFNLRIEDFVSYSMKPLLSYIFFEDSSSQIPNRYILIDSTSAEEFKEDMLGPLNTLETYYHVLNILGKRLTDHPENKITIVGTNSDQGAEKNNKPLSLDRAKSVKNYLVNTWKIDESRIRVSERNLPKEASSNDEPGGVEENRRVEIIPDSDHLLEPVFTVDTVRRMNKTKIKFVPEVFSQAGLRNWYISANQSNKELIRFSGNSEIPAEVFWNISESDTSAPLGAGQITYKLYAFDKLGQIAESDLKLMPVDQITIDRKRLERKADKEYEYYSLILFDFGKTNLGAEHKEVLDFIKSRIKDNSIVTITGHSDKIGEEETNQKLSERRADAAAKRLKIPNAQILGQGENDLLFNNDLPEGRFYCRTVRINIETPVEEIE